MKLRTMNNELLAINNELRSIKIERNIQNKPNFVD
jgi:hypothetical protein